MASEAVTLTTAMANAPTSTEKTALLVDLNSLYSELATTQAAGAFSADVLAQLQQELIDFAERLGAEMTDHS